VALLFGASGSDRVNWGSGATLDDAVDDSLTYLAWIYQNAGDLSGGIMTKGTSGGGGTRRSFELRDSVTDDALFGIVDCATTDAQAESAAGTMVTGVWQAVGMTYDHTTQVLSLYYGTLATAIAEVSYASQITGSGDEGDNSALDQFVGCYGGGTTGSVAQVIAFAAKYQRVLSLNEMKHVLYARGVVPGAVLNAELGFPATTCLDRSGNGHTGTVTGATTSAHVPLPHPFQATRQRQRIIRAAAAAGDAVPQCWAQYRRRAG